MSKISKKLGFWFGCLCTCFVYLVGHTFAADAMKTEADERAERKIRSVEKVVTVCDHSAKPKPGCAMTDNAITRSATCN